jgi:subtilisin family serine protease
MKNPFHLDATPARVLVRLPAGASGASASLSLAGASVALEPLCPNEHRAREIGLAPSQHWYAARVDAAVSSASDLWELAHEAMRSPALASAGAAGFAEPDLPQIWHYENRIRATRGGLGAAPGETCEFNPQDADFPCGPELAWHLADAFSQLRSARAAAAEAVAPIRIGILDTGFDLGHQTLPALFRRDLARNFVRDGQAADDVADRFERGLFNNPGHGTGTLGLLAGRALATPPQACPFPDAIGGAPGAEIIPLRVATSVVLFKTGAVAEALDYLIAPDGDSTLRADVVSMSMGGLASRAWADVVNRAYDAGIVIVTAAGNNYPLTPQSIVYPARFKRVIAACGVMADGRPYIRRNVLPGRMAGNYGPPSKMATALSAYTPNTPWAEINCEALIDMDGAGTSSATPQIAAAAALWLQKHKPSLALDAPWKTVEAVRHALFASAGKAAADPDEFLGRGVLRAKNALGVLPLSAPQITAPDSASFALIRGLFGVGMAEAPREAMLELELTQLIQSDVELATRLGDTDAPGRRLGDAERRHLIDRVVSELPASAHLREALKAVYPARNGASKPGTRPPAPAAYPPRRIATPIPTRRLLRGYAFDPQLSTELESAEINEIVYDVRWEPDLKPGPCGDYLDVIDYDPASGGFYQPVDLNHPDLLAQDGLAPSEGNPQFHHQMVYAVAMRTIEHFEHALGRRVLWSPRLGEGDDREYVGQLRVYPHALRQQNAYYDPRRKALLFGYFPAADTDPGRVYPEGAVFTCLSQDIVAHEITHAILDGVHRSLLYPSNPDTLAFHEAFADIVALFQHFSLPEVLRHQIASTRGDLASQNRLGELAQQFGQAIGKRGALRNAIGGTDPAGKWRRIEADPSDYQKHHEPHDRGAVLVAAVFDAFLSIYKGRVADLLRIASEGTGILPEGNLHPDLVNRLTEEAARAARHVLEMCIRALDYCPPVDITFGDYLRAIVTADFEHDPVDEEHRRVAFVEAFRRRGIVPEGVQAFSVDGLLWRPASAAPEKDEEVVLDFAKSWATDIRSWGLSKSRQALHELIAERRLRLHLHLHELSRDSVVLSGIHPDLRFEVHSLRPSLRIDWEGKATFQWVIELTQRIPQYFDNVDHARQGVRPDYYFLGGCTLLVDAETGRVRYSISKRLDDARKERQRRYFLDDGNRSLAATYFGGVASEEREPFAMLHRY